VNGGLPTFQPVTSRLRLLLSCPTRSLRADLRRLREAWFTGIVTYGAAIPPIPEIAHDFGFYAMLLGIWDPFGAWERAEALRAVAVHKDFIAGIVVGNEGFTKGRCTIDRLGATGSAIVAIRRTFQIGCRILSERHTAVSLINYADSWSTGCQ